MNKYVPFFSSCYKCKPEKYVRLQFLLSSFPICIFFNKYLFYSCLKSKPWKFFVSFSEFKRV
jgi:hypothetical protein